MMKVVVLMRSERRENFFSPSLSRFFLLSLSLDKIFLTKRKKRRKNAKQQQHLISSLTSSSSFASSDSLRASIEIQQERFVKTEI